MTSAPWSSRPKIDDILLSDFFMRRTPTRTVKNQEILVSEVSTLIGDQLFGSSVNIIESESDLPAVTNGFHQLAPLESYIFVKQGITIASPILLPAGYIGYLENTFLDANGVSYINGVTSSLINTLNLEGPITAFADSTTESGTKITVTSTAHGILDGQFVNIKKCR